MSRKWVLLLVLAVSLVLAVGCTSGQKEEAAATAATATKAPAPKPKPGGEVRVRLFGSPTELEVVTGAANRGARVYGQIFDSLLFSDPDTMELKPGLAESWTSSDDGKVLTIKLRKGTKFHDGTDFNAEAVKFHFDRVLSEETPRLRGQFKELVSAEVLDDHTVRLNLSAPSAPVLAATAEMHSTISSPTAVRKWGNKEYSKNPVGTGPFKFVEWVSGDRVVVERNPNYWQKDADGNQLPYLEKITWQIIEDSVASIVALKGGSLDMVDLAPLKDLKSLDSTPGLKVISKPSIGWHLYFLNPTREPFTNKACRQAVSYAVDRKALVDAVFDGMPPTAKGFASPVAWYYDSDFKGQYYDPAKAKAKLAECGKAGGFTFTLLSFTDPSFTEAAEAIQAMLAQVGIKMKIDAQETTANYAADRQRPNPYDAHTKRWSGFLNPREPLNLWFACESKRGWCNKDFEDYLAKAENTYDRNEQAKWYRKIDEVLTDEAVMVALYHEINNMVVNDKIEGFNYDIKNWFDFTRVFWRK